MKIAHIILVHNNPLQLKRLIERIVSSECRVFVHLDLKCKIGDFPFLNSMPNVTPIVDRQNVHWGGYSMIKAIIESFMEVVHSGYQFDYVNLISGQDYPIKSNAEFSQFLKKNPNCDFFEFHVPGHIWVEQAQARFTRYHLTDYKFKGSTKLERIINLVLPHKKLPSNFTIIGHSGWFTIDYQSVEYVLNFFKENKSFIRKFKFSWGSDEFLIPSILYNSPLKHKIVNNNLRYIDWSEGKASPKILTVSDMAKLEQSEAFFARKFNMNVDAEILNLLDKKLDSH